MGERKQISRRRFLTLAGGAVGATAVACGGLAVLGTRQPAVEFAKSSCGSEDEMGKGVLVAYASRCGSTGEIAETIGQALCERGAAADVRLAKEVTDICEYRAVVVGSAVRAGHWLPEAVDFVKAHQEALGGMPMGYFLACLTMMEDTEEARREAAAYLDPVRELVEPVDVGLFAGAMDYGKLPFAFRRMMKAMNSPEGDFRDWVPAARAV